MNNSADRLARDAGETLVELLVTIVILGITASSLLGAVSMAVATSRLNRQQADVTVYLRSWAEQVKNSVDTAAPWATCSARMTAVGSAAPAIPVDDDISVKTPVVQSWNAGTSDFVTCVDGATVQRVTLSVTVKPGLMPSFDQSLAVVIRKP